MEETVEVVKVVAQEHAQQRGMDKIFDVPLSQVVEKILPIWSKSHVVSLDAQSTTRTKVDVLSLELWAMRPTEGPHGCDSDQHVQREQHRRCTAKV